MKCKCGGLMQLRRLSIDTEAHVCMLCGRDDIPRRTAADFTSTAAVAAKELAPKTKRQAESWKVPRTCPRCGRDKLKFTGCCQRCRYRMKLGLDCVTGLPLQVAA